MFSMLTNRAHAISAGYERYLDDVCEVYFEYLPAIPYDPNCPSANEEFGFIYEISQKSYWDWWDPLQFVKRVPNGFVIEVMFQDMICHNEDFVTWKRWFPFSITQYGATIEWSLGLSHGLASIGTSVRFSDISGIKHNYTEHEEPDGWLSLAYESLNYNSNWFWNGASCSGGGSIGIRNDLAPTHEGHQCLVRVDITLKWEACIIGTPLEYKTITFVFGDDIPANTDCMLFVEQGNTDFNYATYVARPSRGGGKCYYC